MGEMPLSLRLDAKVMSDLEYEARLREIPEADMAAEAIAEFLDRQAYKREMIAEAVAEADKGVFISGEAMIRWIESWDTDAELPPPEPDIFPESEPR